MLTRILLTYMLRTAALVVGLGAVVGYLVGGWGFAAAVLWGGAIVGGSGAVQIWLVGVLFDPEQGTPTKVVTGTLLLLKLLLVAGVLWWVLSRTNPDQVGLLLGMGLGLAGLVVGVHRGSSSRAGRQAMDDASQEIEEKMEDTEDEKR